MTDQHISNQSPHYDFIDAVRAIAALLVLMQHALERSGLEGLGNGAFALRWLNFGQAGVAAFFIVSGFVIPLSLEKWNDLSRFWLSRICRIYPLYIFVYVLILLLSGPNVLEENFHNIHDVVISVTAHAFFAQQYLHLHDFMPQSWTLSLEFIWYGIFSLFFMAAINKRSALISFFTLNTASILAVTSLASPLRIPMGRIGLLVLCVLGLLFYRKEKKQIRIRMFAAAIFVMLYSAALCLVVGAYFRPGANSIALSLTGAAFSWLLGFAIFTALFCTRHTRIWSAPWLKYLGLISYSIYLVHEPIMLIMEKFPITGLPYMAILFPATIFCASLTYRYIECPAIAWAHNRWRRART